MTGKDEPKKEGKQTIFDKLAKNDTYRRAVLIAVFAGIALIFLSSFFKNDSTGSVKPACSQTCSTTEQYAANLEQSLTDIVSRIQGAGATKVLVTLERSTEYVYATEEKKSDQTAEDRSGGTATKNEANVDTETTYILVKDADGAQKAIPITEVQPVIKGVVVVCDGGDNPTVQQNIISAVTTALDVTSVRVCVIKAK